MLSLTCSVGVLYAIYSNDKCVDGLDGFNWPLLHIKDDKVGEIESFKCWNNVTATAVEPLVWKGQDGSMVYLGGGWSQGGATGDC